MHRLLVDMATLGMECAILTKDNATHLKVLRPKDGEKFELFDGRGSSRIYKWDGAAKRLMATNGKTVKPSDPHALTLFACVTKGQRWDWTIQKATELGVSRIVPVVSGRTIVRIDAGERATKRERWQRIAEEAARQSDAAWLPEIAEPLDFDAAVAEAARTTCFVGALVEPPPQSLLAAAQSAIAAGTTGEFSVFVGPEGDFAPQELAALLKVATPTNFGPTILRAETAAIYALCVVAAALRTEENAQSKN